MVSRIYDIKNQVLDRIDQDLRERGIERADMTQMGMMVDMVKDLAEAEKDCWKAEYYRSVTEAMGDGKSGYGDYGMRQRMPEQNVRRGYHDRMGNDMVESVRMALQGMAPDERDRMRDQLRKAMEY